MDMNSFLAERVHVEHALRELMKTDPTDDQLVEFFRKPGPFRHFGNNGDCMGWTARQTAQHALDNAKPFNGLTPAEAERLACASEESGEVGQAIGKILRHGYESHHPDFPLTSNREMLEKELGDVVAVMEMMVEAGDLNTLAIRRHADAKRKNLPNFLHHN